METQILNTIFNSILDFGIENNLILSIFLGIGLSAAAGFRIFIPLFALSLSAYMNWLPLNEDFAWVSGTTPLIVLGIASIVEIASYYIPVIDNLLDSAAVPMAAVAGTALMGATLVDLPEVATWALAIIAGGGTAATISGATAATRVTSTATTAGVANPMVNTAETAAASVLSATAIIWAPIAFILALIVLYGVYKLFIFIKKQRKLLA